MMKNALLQHGSLWKIRKIYRIIETQLANAKLMSPEISYLNKQLQKKGVGIQWFQVAQHTISSPCPCS